MNDLRDQLQSIYDNKGTLTPELVVETARPEDHPLHNRFEWEDGVAGELWRRHQAHELITSVKVVYRQATDSNEPASIRVFHAVRGPEGVVYEPADVIAQDPVLTDIVLRDMEREWRQLHRRYGLFAEFIEMIRRDLAA